jgi:hypothetical protein
MKWLNGWWWNWKFGTGIEFLPSSATCQAPAYQAQLTTLRLNKSRWQVFNGTRDVGLVTHRDTVHLNRRPDWTCAGFHRTEKPAALTDKRSPADIQSLLAHVTAFDACVLE